MSLKNIRKFIKGSLEGTRLEIMPSKSATRLPNGTPILWKYSSGGVRDEYLNPTQVAHRNGQVDVHKPQEYTITEKNKVTSYVGPSIAQEWKLLYQGKRPFYQVDKDAKP